MSHFAAVCTARGAHGAITLAKWAGTSVEADYIPRPLNRKNGRPLRPLAHAPMGADPLGLADELERRTGSRRIPSMNHNTWLFMCTSCRLRKNVTPERLQKILDHLWRVDTKTFDVSYLD